MSKDCARDTLIIVPCHGIWKWDLSEAKEENFGQYTNQWFLASFQVEGNDHHAFIKHALRAIEQHLQPELFVKSIVLFSGSQTKKDAGCMSEAQSYYFLAKKLIEHYSTDPTKFQSIFKEDLNIVKHLANIIRLIKERGTSIEALFIQTISTEESALDSFENLLYSYYRFAQFNGNKLFPKKVIVSGFEFKENRFLKYHSHALDIDPMDITFLSVEPQPPNYTKGQLQKYFDDLYKMENKNALKLFEQDWYGRRDPLYSKKQSRNPFNRIPSYGDVQLLDLSLDHQDDEKFFQTYVKGKMPWSKNK